MKQEQPLAAAVSSQGNFIWVRLVSIHQPADLAPWRFEVHESPDRVYFKGPRPPDSAVTPGQRPKRGGSSDDYEFLGQGVWTIDPDFFGLEHADTVVDLGPAFVDRDDAVHWIQCAGKDWGEQCINRFLMRFDAFDTKTWIQRRPNEAQPPKRRGEPMTSFPDQAWDDMLKPVLDKKPPPQTGAWSFDLLGQSVSMPSQPVCDLSCCNEPAFKQAATLTAQQREAIAFEGQGFDQVTYRMLRVVGLSTDQPVDPALKGLRRAVVQLSVEPLWHFKRLSDAPRPDQVCDDIPAMFRYPHIRYPGHPAYPGGHAMLATVWAELLASVFLQHKQLLDAQALSIAWNRQLAGLHFERDTVGGQALGRHVARVLLDNSQPPSGATPAEAATPFLVELLQQGMECLRKLAQARQG